MTSLYIIGPYFHPRTLQLFSNGKHQTITARKDFLCIQARIMKSKGKRAGPGPGYGPGPVLFGRSGVLGRVQKIPHAPAKPRDALVNDLFRGVGEIEAQGVLAGAVGVEGHARYEGDLLFDGQVEKVHA